jgi:hypothetical protein
MQIDPEGPRFPRNSAEPQSRVRLSNRLAPQLRVERDRPRIVSAPALSRVVVSVGLVISHAARPVVQGITHTNGRNWRNRTVPASTVR